MPNLTSASPQGTEPGPVTIDRLLHDTLRQTSDRITALQLPNGRRFWLKRVEKLSLRLRLQKGDPARALSAEREGLRYLAARGLPVPEILREGKGYLLLPDAGTALSEFAHPRAGHTAEEISTAFASAGKAMALLHKAGLSHGRPAPRDICWDGRTARFIDLERFSPRRRSRFWQAMDVLILTQSCYTLWPRDSRWLEAALQSYASHAPSGAMAAADRLARRLFWLRPLTRLLLRLKPHSRELNAAELTLGRLTR